MNHLLSKIGSYPFEKLNLLHKDIKPSKDVINLSIGEPKLNADSKVLDILNKETNSFSNYPPMNAVPELSEAYRQYLKNHFGIENVAEDEVCLVAGTREGTFSIIQALFNKANVKEKPYVVMVVGVNGVGKTTTIGKLAHFYKLLNKKIILGAADTFRAGAIDQLQIWADRVKVPLIRQEMGSDPASVAFDTVQAATAQDKDIVLIDTAGRLHNKVNLMNELTKIKRVMSKVIPNAPHEVLLVLDGSTGQNAFEQAKQFTNATEVTSLAITKLDGTAKGGVLLGISDQFQIPVRFIGVGEGIDDLQEFDPQNFIQTLFS